MALANLGFGGAVGIGRESTWGTPVARSNWLRIVSWGVKRTTDKVARPHLGTHGATSHNRRQHFLASDNVGGSFEYLAAYDDSTVLLLFHALGANVTAGVGPYTHTLTLASPQVSANPGLTLEGLLGDTSGADAEVFEGCKLSRTEISIAAADVMRIRHDVIGETSGGLAAQGTPTFSSNGEEILHSHAGQFAFNGTNYDLVDMSLVIDHKLAVRQLLGSALTKEPQPSDFLEVSGRVTIEYVGTEPNDDWLTEPASADGTITFTGSGNNVAAFTLQNLYIKDVSRTISSAGVVRETVEFMCESDGTAEGLQIVVTNDNSAATDN